MGAEGRKAARAGRAKRGKEDRRSEGLRGAGKAERDIGQKRWRGQREGAERA